MGYGLAWWLFRVLACGPGIARLFLTRLSVRPLDAVIEGPYR